VIRIAATSGEPSTCKELRTQRFLEQTEFAEGREAVRRCIEDESPAREAEISRIEVDGDHATADTTFRGGTFDGQTLSLALVQAGGEWKLDRVTGFRNFDKGAFVSAFADSFPGTLDVRQGRCIARFFLRIRDERLQQVLLGGDPKPLRALYALCA
jgi:hypothetical protein